MKLAIFSICSLFLIGLFVSCDDDSGTSSNTNNSNNINNINNTNNANNINNINNLNNINNINNTNNTNNTGDDIVADHTNSDLADIPEAAITNAKNTLHIAYQHTSHGSQIITGMNSLELFPPFSTLYSWDDSGNESGALDLDDLGIPGDAPDLSVGDSEDASGNTPWSNDTRALLDAEGNEHINVVVWSWCSINGHNAQLYVDNMERLIGEYPEVTFIFLTGHSEGQGEDLTENSVHYNNQLIRQHCADNNRWLFDFADIEAHNPNGEYFWDLDMQDNLDYTDGNWAVEWIAANPDSELAQLTTGTGVDGFDGTSGCAHSDSPQESNLNCVLKGRAFWWILSRIAGWDGTPAK